MRKLLPWLAGAALFAGGVATLIAFVANTAHPTDPTARGGAPQRTPVEPPTVKLDPRARLVAGKYVVTAMTRQNLPLAWRLTDPTLRAGYTYRQWLTGNIPVQYFPADAIDAASFKVDESHASRAMLQLYIFAKPKSGVSSQDFFIGLRKRHDTWRVDYVAPHNDFGVPALD